jgi:diguanylate cyclase (GGDEF)-like protein
MKQYYEKVVDTIERQNFFKMPLRHAVVLFSILLFTTIACGSFTAYYFAMKKVLSESYEHELWQTINTRQLLLNANLEKEVLALKILAESPAVISYFSNPSDEILKKDCFSMFEHYTAFFYSKMLGWISIKDSNYYVNGQFMEKYHYSNPAHSWFFETLAIESPPLIRVDFDYLNRQIYDLYIDYPIYNEDKVVGVINSRISLFEFVNNLNLPENVYVFGKDGIVIAAADNRIAKEKKTLVELFGIRGEAVYKKSLNLSKKSTDTFEFGNRHYLMSNAGDLDLFLAARYEVDFKRIMQERESIVFLSLLMIMLVVFVIFNIFLLYLLKPINRTMLSYIESSLLDELTKLPNKRFFNIRMEDEWSRAIRGKYPICFLMLDLDNFKKYNDSHGHLEGDRLLREVARIFSYCINRTSDFAIRFGGEEFCVILPNTKIEGAKKIAENIRVFMERTRKATISIGLVCKTPVVGDNMQEFINQADQKLYEAKNSGRNKVCL